MNTTTQVRILNNSVIAIAVTLLLVLLVICAVDVLLKYNDARIENGVQERMKQLQEEDAEKELPVRVVLHRRE